MNRLNFIWASRKKNIILHHISEQKEVRPQIAKQANGQYDYRIDAYWLEESSTKKLRHSSWIRAE